jgi:hypothetical protein
VGADEEELQARAVRLRAAGATLVEIEAALGVGSTRLARWMRGVPVPDRRGMERRWSERRRRALELRLRGASYREIQAELGVPKSTLSGWLADVP